MYVREDKEEKHRRILEHIKIFYEKCSNKQKTCFSRYIRTQFVHTIEKDLYKEILKIIGP